MPSHPVRFQFTNIAQHAASEAAARRRMRAMEAVYTAVLQWDVCVEAHELPDAGGRFAATARARIVGGDVLAGKARAGDPLGALRLAFNRLEAELESEHEDARTRAAAWLNTVKRRITHRAGLE